MEKILDNVWVRLIYKIIVPFILMPIALITESDFACIALLILLIPLLVVSVIAMIIIVIKEIAENF